MAEYRRAAVLRCPGCDDVMAEQLCGEAQVDICPSCQGIWIDWLDGDIATVTASVGELGASEPRGDGTDRCPLCQQDLDRAMIDEEVVVWRCGGCAGAFVPRESVALLGGRGRDEDADAGRDPLLTRILDAIGQLLFG